MKDNGTLAAIKMALFELKKRGEGDFNGLTGSIPQEAAVALGEITYYVRDYLLDRYDEKEVRRLQAKYSDSLLGSNSNKTLNWAPASDGVELALGILNLIGSIFGVDGEQLSVLLSGTDGLRGLKVRQGGEKGARRRHGKPADAPKRTKILEAAKKDDGPKWGRIVRIAKKAGCEPQYAGKVLKENRS